MGWNANTTKRLSPRSRSIMNKSPFHLYRWLCITALGFPSELSNNSPQRTRFPQLCNWQQTMAKAKCLFCASLFEPLSQDSYKTQSGSFYEFLLSVQLGLTSNWDDTHCSKKNRHMYIGWHCFSFSSTSKHENPDYNIANFDAIKLPCFRGMFLHPPQWKMRAYTWRNH